MKQEECALSEVVDVVGGRLVRDATFANLGFAIHEGNALLSWVEGKKFLPPILKNKGISAVIASPDVMEALPDGMGVLVHDEPRQAFYRLHNHLARATPFYASHERTVIHPSAVVDAHASVADTGVHIGAEAVIESGARLLPGVRVGARSIVRTGVVLGSQGFQFFVDEDRRKSVDHVGGVELGEDVEIQANTHVARAIFRGATRIESDAKVDALVHVAHNVRIGSRTRICAGVVIGGSVVMEEDVYIGPGATITNCIRIGQGARITLGSVVVRSVLPGQHVTGHWAVSHDRFVKGFGRMTLSD